MQRCAADTIEQQQQQQQQWFVLLSPCSVLSSHLVMLLLIN